MLAAMEPGTLDELIALQRVQPFGDDQLTRLALKALLHQGCETSYQELREREEVDEREDADTAVMWANVRRALGG